MTTPLNSHGLIVARAPSATPTVFTDIAELKTTNIPSLSRNEFDASVQNRNIDSWVLGFPRRKAVQLTLNYIPSDPTHDHLTGLMYAYLNNSIDGYKFYHTPSSFLWVASGQVQMFDIKPPTDGIFEADVTLRMSGLMTLNGEVLGT